MIDTLSRDDRLRLMKFVCSFAWADLEVRPEERHFVAQLISRLELDAEEARMVERWLELPPAPEAVDPLAIPREHRQLFLEAVAGVIVSDGEVADAERESLQLLKDLLDLDQDGI